MGRERKRESDAEEEISGETDNGTDVVSVTSCASLQTQQSPTLPGGGMCDTQSLS